MKKLTVLLTCILLLIGCTPPVSATGEREIISYSEKTLDNGITVVEVITALQSDARATTKSYEKRVDFDDNGELIASIAITGVFSYDGTTVSVVSKSISTCETYDGWSFKQSSFTSSGGTISLKGKLSKLLIFNSDISITLTCDKNGNIS